MADEKAKAVKKTSVTFAGITSETLQKLNEAVEKSGLNRAEFLKNVLDGVQIQASSGEIEKSLATELERLQASYEKLERENANLARKYDICKKFFFIPDKLGVILRALIEMQEVKTFAEGIDYILEPYWKQNKLVADQSDIDNYLAWKQKVLQDGVDE